ncbi:hypothetical protein DKY64_19115 [Stenotrophomonas maltophilia]|nr:hypothetical protein DKY64_19115 [Stenotrophomonas maltophilia]
MRGVSRMDAAAKPTRTYLRRPRTPTSPRHPTECLLLTLTLPWLEASVGAGRSPAEQPST